MRPAMNCSVKAHRGWSAARKLLLIKLSIDDIEATDVKAVVVEGATVSLLGLPFLNEVDEIVISKGKMTLRKHG